MRATRFPLGRGERPAEQAANRIAHLLAAGRPRAAPAEPRKPRTIANSSGSSSRKASWPLSVTISAKETRAELALRACTMARDSAVGNSQSEVNEITQKRVRVP